MYFATLVSIELHVKVALTQCFSIPFPPLPKSEFVQPGSPQAVYPTTATGDYDMFLFRIGMLYRARCSLLLGRDWRA